MNKYKSSNDFGGFSNLFSAIWIIGFLFTIEYNIVDLNSMAVGATFLEKFGILVHYFLFWPMLLGIQLRGL